MARLVWICDSCGEECSAIYKTWPCPGCDNEVCENCSDWYAHCRSCSRDADPKDLIKRANDAGWDFDEDEAM